MGFVILIVTAWVIWTLHNWGSDEMENMRHARRKREVRAEQKKTVPSYLR